MGLTRAINLERDGPAACAAVKRTSDGARVPPEVDLLLRFAVAGSSFPTTFHRAHLQRRESIPLSPLRLGKLEILFTFYAGNSGKHLSTPTATVAGWGTPNTVYLRTSIVVWEKITRYKINRTGKGSVNFRAHFSMNATI